MSPSRVGRCGRKRKTYPRVDRLLVGISKRDSRKTSGDLKRGLEAHGVNIDSSTVRRRLLVVGRRAHKPQNKQLLTSPMKKKRLLWAKAYKHCTTDDWRKVSSGIICRYLHF